MLTDEEFRCFLKALGARVKQLRKEKKIRLRDIMVSTGYYDAQWRKYEAGGGLTVQSLMKIALALNVSLSCLLDDLGQWPLQNVAEIEQNKNVEEEAPAPPQAAPAKGKKLSPSRH